MTVEYIRERAFLQEVEAAGEVWVAKSIYQNIHALEIENHELSLPVWSNRERAAGYLKHANLIGPKYEPHAVPLKTFANAWLSDKAMAISEIQINPNGTETRVLCLTSEEFQDAEGLK
jgi:hypothetical protein